MSYYGGSLDYNRNGVIDRQDLATMNYYGINQHMDVNRNGMVDFQDLRLLGYGSRYPNYTGGYYGNRYGNYGCRRYF